MNTFLFLIGFIPIVTIAQNENHLFDKLEFGRFNSGYKFMEAYDRSRPPLAEQPSKDGRIVPVYFWYPSSEVPKATMTLKRYFEDLAFSLGEKVGPQEKSQKAAENFAKYHFDVPDSTLQAYMNLEISTMAERDLAMAEGNFPLVVFSHGNVDRWWIWGEYLASHGIAVIGTPNAGTLAKRHEMGLSGLETQIRDAQFAVSIVSKNSNIDQESVIAIGSSYGSLTAAGYATRDPRVKGVISLDGIIADVNEGELLTKTPYFDYQRFNTPILHVNSGFIWSSNYRIMDRLIYADQYRIVMDNMRHSDYHFEGMADLFGVNFRGRKLVDNSTGFKSLSKYLLAFIQGVTGLPEQLKFKLLTSKLEDVSDITFIKGIGNAYSADELLAIIRTAGFDSAENIYLDAQKINDQPFSLETFYEVGLTLHRYGMLAEEIKWFGYFRESYPKSSDAQYRLARLIALSGDQKAGKELLRKTIELIPNDPHISDDRKAYLSSRVEFFLK